MLQARQYKTIDREQEKERQRASDAAQLREGKVSLEDLRERNAFLSPLQILESSISCREVFD